MLYEGTVYRPPSEAGSLLVQATIGCAWNRCTFCGMYKDKQFRIRPLEDIVKDLREGARYRDQIRRIFLCDGDALMLPTDTLREILAEIRRLYPGLAGVRVYASVRDVLRKSVEELSELGRLGLDMVFLGLESGSDRVLAAVDKGITKGEMIAAAEKLLASGIRQSVSIIAGLGGERGMEEHILETADALNHMQPDYVGMLVLYFSGGAGPSRAVGEGQLRLPSTRQVLEETELLLQNLSLRHCFFSSAHVSNYFHLKGNLPRDRDRMLAQLRHYQAAVNGAEPAEYL